MPPRVLFLGYGDIGVSCLRELLNAGCDVIGVFCRSSDRTVRKDTPSVFTFARHEGLHCFKATDPGAPQFSEEVDHLRPDLLLSIQYDRILKPPLLAIPKQGSYNLHFGPLPRLRGCFPTKWAILGDEPSGVTFHCIERGIDSGDIIGQKIIPLVPDETDESLYCKLQEAAKQLFEEQLSWIRALSSPPRRPQDHAAASYYPKRLPYDGRFDWNAEAAWIERFIRAFTFPPYPAAITNLANKEIEIPAPVKVGPDLMGCLPGEWEAGNNGVVAVQCGKGSLSFAEVILEGKKQLAAHVLADAL